MMSLCYHCGESVLTGLRHQVEILGVNQVMCCPGCEAIAKTIIEQGLGSYYEFRTSPAEKSTLIPDDLNALSFFDNTDVQKDFVHQEEGRKHVVLFIHGLSCAACAWLIEKKLQAVDGTHFIQVNSTTNRATLQWDPSKTKLSHLLGEIQALGYNAAPFEQDTQEEYYKQDMKKYLYKIGIAGLGTMQVMMLAVAMYFDVLGGMDSDTKDFFRWVSLIFATPILLYCATPFYKNAWKNIKARSLGMDVPVSIALLFSYCASAYATVTGKGEVYFESVAMFTFFLLIGRFLELRVKRISAAQSTHLLTLIPRLATLVSGERCPVHSLCVGDCLLVLPGESFPADGVILKGKTTLDESMLTGESMPVFKKKNDRVFAGTQNIEGHVTVKVVAIKQDAMINQIIRLQERAHAVKPRVGQMAETVSRYFVGIILILASLTWVYWSQERPDDAFWIMLSVLVATCPCALSLATPTAITCATTRFNQSGILLRRGNVFETLTKINHVIFDKTGTLTQGNVSLVETYYYDDNEKKEIEGIACALELYASHPIARAFKECEPNKKMTDIENVLGEGVQGWCNGDLWRIGKLTFALDDETKIAFDDPHFDHCVWLSKNGKKAASFQLSDPIRQSSKTFIQELKKQGIKVTLLTGDNETSARNVSHALGISSFVFGVSPKGKWEYIKNCPKEDIVMMVGDGINDMPVLAGAHLSVAMGEGSDAAKNAADLILMNNDLTLLLRAKKEAHFTQGIIYQNLAWALGYNLFILPLAMMGWVAPYIAVIGMSASSLLVVTNSLRLLKKKKRQGAFCEKEQTRDPKKLKMRVGGT